MRKRDWSSYEPDETGWYHEWRCSNDSFIKTLNSGTKCPSAHVNFMYDELLPKSDFRTRNVRHVDVKYCLAPISTHIAVASNMSVYAKHLPRIDNLANTCFDDAVNNWRDSSFYGDMDAFNARAYEAMLPSLEADVSLTNFLLELADLKQLLRLFRPSSDLSKKISEGHLTWNFGIKPLISDVAEIYNSLSNYEKRLRDFLDRRGKPQKRYYSESTDEGDDTIAWSMSTYGQMSGYRLKYKLRKTATMSYTYQTQDIVSRLDKLQALRGMLGLKLTPSVIWEAIPYSFLVDYVINVQQWLRSLENDVIEPTVEITDYSISTKLSFSEHRYFRYLEPCTGSLMAPPGYTFSVVAGKVYNRRRALPETEGIPLSLSLPGSNQLALAASLLNVRRR